MLQNDDQTNPGYFVFPCRIERIGLYRDADPNLNNPIYFTGEGIGCRGLKVIHLAIPNSSACVILIICIRSP